MKQTIVILPTLQLALRRPMSDVPNTKGFRLLGVLPNRTAIPLHVDVDANGCHYLADQFNSHRLPSVFDGWVPDDAKR
jgi:hypothetical protein